MSQWTSSLIRISVSCQHELNEKANTYEHTIIIHTMNFIGLVANFSTSYPPSDLLNQKWSHQRRNDDNGRRIKQLTKISSLAFCHKIGNNGRWKIWMIFFHKRLVKYFSTGVCLLCFILWETDHLRLWLRQSPELYVVVCLLIRLVFHC